MPPTNTNEGLVTAQRIRAGHPGVGVLVLSQYVETRQAVKLLQNAPQRVGYLLKDRVSNIAEFADAVRRIARGGSVIDPEVVAQLLRRHGEDTNLADLTGRERDILALMAQGRSNRAICERLFLSPKQSKPMLAPFSPSSACCPPLMTTGGSSRCSPISGTPNGRQYRGEPAAAMRGSRRSGVPARGSRLA